MLKNLFTIFIIFSLSACDKFPHLLRRAENEGMKFYWETEADKHDVEAAYRAAKKYCCGPDTLKQDIEALNLFCTAAKEGHRASMFEIGKIYGGYDVDSGSSIPRDNALSFTFFSIAEQNGFEHAESYREELLTEISDYDFTRATELIQNYPDIPCEIVR